MCNKCGSRLSLNGYCMDETCPYSDWPQHVELDELQNMSTDKVEAKYGIKKRTISDSWGDIVNAQDWNSPQKVIHLEAFIRNIGLERELSTYAQEVANEENNAHLEA